MLEISSDDCLIHKDIERLDGALGDAAHQALMSGLCKKTLYYEFLGPFEPLGSEFERVWDESVDKLYEK